MEKQDKKEHYRRPSPEHYSNRNHESNSQPQSIHFVVEIVSRDRRGVLLE